MDDLIAFVRAQLDEDERVARAIQDDRYGDNADGKWKTWTIEQDADRTWPYLGALGVELAHSYADNVITPQRGEHIVRWDPARVLAEVEAKRLVLDQFGEVQGFEDQIDGEWGHGRWPGDAPDRASVKILRALAQPYAGQNGWREEWRA